VNPVYDGIKRSAEPRQGGLHESLLHSHLGHPHPACFHAIIRAAARSSPFKEVAMKKNLAILVAILLATAPALAAPSNSGGGGGGSASGGSGGGGGGGGGHSGGGGGGGGGHSSGGGGGGGYHGGSGGGWHGGAAGSHASWSHGAGLGTGGAAHAGGMHGDHDHHSRHYDNNFAQNYQNNIIPPDTSLCSPDLENIGRNFACAPAVKAHVRTSLR
jgi:hypothetical protein